MKDRPPRVSFQPSEEQSEFLERIKHRFGMAKSHYICSLIKAEMEKEEDRLRPILSVKNVSPHERISLSDGGPVLSSPLPPVPFGTNISDIEKVVSVNSEVKALIRDGKIRKVEPWMPPKATVKST